MPSFYSLFQVDAKVVLLTLNDICVMVDSLQKVSSAFFLPLTKIVKAHETQPMQPQAEKYVQGMVVFLQYHDIVRQRLEHVEEINRSTIHEMETFEDGRAVSSTNYVQYLPKILELGVAQLESINSEFQHALIELEALLQGYYDGLGMVSIIFGNYLKGAAHFNSLLQCTIEKYKSVSFSICTPSNPSTCSHIESLYTMESEREVFYRVFGLNKERTVDIPPISTGDFVEFF